MVIASKLIKSILTETESITTAVGNRIYPIAATAGMDTFPFIAFDHTSVPNGKTKDGGERLVTFHVYGVAKTALAAEQLTDMVLPALRAWFKDEDNKDRFTDFYDNPEFVSEQEQYVAEIDTYMSSITFQLEYNKE